MNIFSEEEDVDPNAETAIVPAFTEYPREDSTDDDRLDFLLDGDFAERDDGSWANEGGGGG
jgi:hypothetical protein